MMDSSPASGAGDGAAPMGQDESLSQEDLTSEFLGLFAKHQRSILLYLTSLLPTQNDVDDVFQETSLALWREFDSFTLGTNFGAWACSIAFNRVRAWRSRRSRESLVFSEAFLQAVSDELIEKSGFYEERVKALESCINALPDHHRELVRHRYDSGYSVEDIAEQAQRSPVAVYRMLSRVRHALHDCVTARLNQQL
ncbi:sigma-70 family RNA polymerase sigma factor [Stieleria sp. TO1_6]|uniref:sigma-70 family RNA polymerase sigma factor n=1 Tax=Stieleria tagensis TaxID=2956795 RepID=UPI00209B75DB|nr:sigma-70 family RNA polymerase sigma factor [Stieleria tagensis]MCO8124334.1 sigma-70 family RNA polymerase sigma factor [Stieleria tagensis]